MKGRVINSSNTGVMKVGLIRSASSLEMEALLASLEKRGCQRIFAAPPATPPSGDGLLSFLADRLEKGDTLVVSGFDAVADTIPEFVSFVADLCRRGVVFESVRERLSTESVTGETSLAGLIEQLSRFEVGSAPPMAGDGPKRRRRTGRPRLLNEGEAKKAHLLVTGQGLPVKRVADDLGVSRATLYRYLEEVKTKVPASFAASRNLPTKLQESGSRAGASPVAMSRDTRAQLCAK